MTIIELVELLIERSSTIETSVSDNDVDNKKTLRVNFSVTISEEEAKELDQL